jgi:hypothetical protein
MAIPAVAITKFSTDLRYCWWMTFPTMTESEDILEIISPGVLVSK